MSLPLLFPWPASLITRPTENGSSRTISNTLTNKIKLKPTTEQRSQPMGGQANYNRWDGVVVILVRTTHKWLANTLTAAPLKTDAHPYQLGVLTMDPSPMYRTSDWSFVMYPRMRGRRPSCDLHPPAASCELGTGRILNYSCLVHSKLMMLKSSGGASSAGWASWAGWAGTGEFRGSGAPGLHRSRVGRIVRAVMCDHSWLHYSYAPLHN